MNQISYSEEQLRYLESSVQEDIFLSACPGSGKTEVLSEKVAGEMGRWTLQNSGIALLTFTNSAENELRSRLVKKLGHQVEYPHYVGTITSWILGYIANPFFHILTENNDSECSIHLIESDTNSNFLFAYQTQYSYKGFGYIKANQFHYEMESLKKFKIVYSLSKEKEGEFGKLLSEKDYMERDLCNVKLKFWKAGFCTYEDVNFLTCQLLLKNENILELIAKKFPIIFIDECQDLSYDELLILYFLHKKGCRLHLVGDLNQAIYEFRKIRPERTLKFIEYIRMQEIILSKNFRSCQPIVEASMKLLCAKDKIVGKCEQKVAHPLKVLFYDKGQESIVLSKYEDILIQEKISSENSRIIVRNFSLKCKLLGTTKSKLNQTINTIEEWAKAVYYISCEQTLENYKESILCLSIAISRSFFRKEEHLNSEFLCKPKRLEIYEWQKILQNIRNKLISCPKLFDFELSWKKWTGILKKLLSLEDVPLCNQNKIEFGNIRGGNAEKKLNEVMQFGLQSINCGIETIHSCKGMSLDSVLFFSSDRKIENSASYWENWFAKDDRDIMECNRLAYVAFSRAKYLLVLAIPNYFKSPISDEQKLLLTDAGFEIVSF